MCAFIYISAYVSSIAHVYHSPHMNGWMMFVKRKPRNSIRQKKKKKKGKHIKMSQTHRFGLGKNIKEAKNMTKGKYVLYVTSRTDENEKIEAAKATITTKKAKRKKTHSQ